MHAPDFKRVFAGPRRSSDAYFTVLAVESGQDAARLGLAVSKKQAKRAVDRNRLKRLIRENFRQRRTRLTGIDLVVMIRAAALDVDNQRLMESLASHFDGLASRINRHEESRNPDQ